VTPTISFIIPTIGRETLTRAVESALAQSHNVASHPQHEVVVVNDSGNDLPRADWFNAPQVRIVDSNCIERSAARNAGATAARGKWLLFLDDDDYLTPDAAGALLDVACETGCSRVYGGYRLVNDADEMLDELRPQVRGDALTHFVAGESIPLGATLFDRALFFKAGAFDTRYATLEDYDFVVRYALVSPVECTDQIVACFRVGGPGGSTDWSKTNAQHRVVRESHLNLPHMFKRIMESASSDPFLRGQAARAYVSSARWNLSSGRIFTGLSRLCCAARVSGWRVISQDYWRAMRQAR
jgi:glycosyltransferase involved in cell wall biosynthesis